MSSRIRSIAAAAVVGSAIVLRASGIATAADLPPPAQPAPAPPLPPYSAPPPPLLSPFYIGGAFNWVHHTGYVPNSPWSAERYTYGAKAFAGFRINPAVQLEFAYHYLGQVPFYEPTPSTERSQAVSGSVLLVSPPLSQWIGPTYLPIHWFVRLGLAYKHITHQSVLGTAEEGILSAVVGTGAEFRLSSRVFARIEYEFLSTAIGGPPQSVPALSSLFDVTFGGTRRTINVMHTPLAITLGINL